MPYISPQLTNIVTAVKKATNSLGRDFSEIEHLQNSVRGSIDFTRLAFDRVEKNLKCEFGKFLPSTPCVCANEKAPKEGMFLSIAGIDGLKNFAHGNPQFAVSAALISGKMVLAGVVYSPVHGEMFFAERGKGAFKEGTRSIERLRVSSRADLEGALVAVRPATDDAEMTARLINGAIFCCKEARVSGSAALDLAYVAAGKLDAAIAPHSMLASVAAGVLLVKEAGGMALDLAQKDTRTEDQGLVLDSGNLVAVNFNLSQKIARIYQ